MNNGEAPSTCGMRRTASQQCKSNIHEVRNLKFKINKIIFLVLLRQIMSLIRCNIINLI